MFKVYAGIGSELLVFLIVLGFFAVIAIVAFILHRVLRPKLKKGEKQPTEKDYAKEELDRVLQPVEDEKVSKEIQDFKQNDDE